MLITTLLIHLFLGESLGAGSWQEEDGKQFVGRLDHKYLLFQREVTEATYNLSLGKTEQRLGKMEEALNATKKYLENKYSELNKYPWRSFKNKTLKRQFKFYNGLLSPGITTDVAKSEHLDHLREQLDSAYTDAHFCKFRTSNCSLREPEMVQIIGTSGDPEELKFTWSEFHNKITGGKTGIFADYVALTNEDARLKGYPSAKDYWLENYGRESFEKSCQKLIEKMMPLYKELHAYTRYKLMKYYGKKIVNETGPIPAHLLGNFWGQSWESIKDIILPFPQERSANITQAMLEQGYTQRMMYEMAENFFVSLNMSKMDPKFWEKSIFQRLFKGFMCNGKAWDMFQDDDFRITFCTEVNEQDLATLHHEMGHIQYYMEYKQQPFCFREGANYAFHEGVGDAISLSVVSNKHLRKIGLLSEKKESKQTRINSLLTLALARIPLIPFSYIIDLHRWNAFDGTYPVELYNCKFWELKMAYQGIMPPEPRSEDYIDILAKYHVANDRSYIRYFGAAFLQFQFYRAMCEKSGQYVPNSPGKRLCDCDFFGSVEAGNAFKTMMSMGSSKPWEDILKEFTGSREMEAGPVYEYFEEIYKWLKEENAKNGVYVGWKIPEEYKCKPPIGMNNSSGR